MSEVDYRALLSEKTRKRYGLALTDAQRQKRLKANPLIQHHDAVNRASKLRQAN